MLTLTWVQFSPWGLIGLIGFLYARGFIVNRRTYNDIVNVMDKRVADKQAEADAWKQTAMLLLQGNRELTAHVGIGAEAAQTAAAALQAVSAPTEGEPGAGVVA
jgi:hypothetical protein